MIFLWILLGLVLFVLLSSFAGFFYIIHRNNFTIEQVSETHPLYPDGLAFQQAAKSEWQVTTSDGLQLHAWYLPAEQPTNKTVIMAHGYDGIRDRFFGFSWLFHHLGYNLVMPEMRASTEAQGRWVGFGWLDKEDMKCWIAQTIKKNPEAEIALWGISMGASTIMMLSGDTLPSNVKCFIEDCGYDSVWNEIKHQLHRYHVPAWPILPLMSFWCKIFAGYDWHEASSVTQLAKNTRPLLLIHGQEDNFVPFSMLAKNAAASQGITEVLEVPKAGHTQAYETDIPLYRQTIRKFLENYL
ncbi:alpha/beta hydrolase [Lactovum odontotermitis]